MVPSSKSSDIIIQYVVTMETRKHKGTMLYDMKLETGKICRGSLIEGGRSIQKNWREERQIMLRFLINQGSILLYIYLKLYIRVCSNTHTRAHIYIHIYIQNTHVLNEAMPLKL